MNAKTLFLSDFNDERKIRFLVWKFFIFDYFFCFLKFKIEDYIECYWCNSRDAYCGKRVTDTMVTTLKCPKTHKCTVYTNPYDNYCK